jgi:hypothetical protein
VKLFPLKNFNLKNLHIKGNNYQNEETTHRKGTLDKGLISSIYKELQKLNNKRTNGIVNEWAYTFNSSQKKFKCLINT